MCPYDVEEGEDDGVPASEVRLDEVLAAPGDVLTYLYDYGDDWHHRLLVEQVGPAVEDVRLLAGHGAAPPEDSGGVWDWDWDWDADAAPPWDLAEAQGALAVWSATRSMPPAGSKGGREAVLSVVRARGLHVPTAQMPHRLPDCTSIDHVAVPVSWSATARRVTADGLSDHDMYVVDASRSAS